MNGINLIPAPRQFAKRSRVHVRCCISGCAAWLVLSIGAAALAHVVWRAEDPMAAERLAKANEEIQRTERIIAGLHVQLAAAQSALRANQAIAAQPDWSILLGLLGHQVGDDVVLKSCNLRPATARAPARPEPRRGTARPAGEAPTAAPEAPAIVLEASGMAFDHAAANKFVLRLERTGLFSKVSLLDTAREPFFDKNAIAFRLECAINQAPPETTPSTAAAATARGGD